MFGLTSSLQLGASITALPQEGKTGLPQRGAAGDEFNVIG